MTTQQTASRAHSLDQAIQFYNEGQYKKAFLNLVQISNTHSHDMEYLRLMADVQMRLGDQNSSLKTLKVIASKTSSFEDSMNYAKQLMNVGKFNEAIIALLAIDASSLEIFKLTLLNKHLLNCYLSVNDSREIMKILSFYETNKVEDDVSSYARAFMCIQDEKIEEAVSFLRKSVGFNPKNDKSWVSLALVHHRMGDMELAIGNLEKALDANNFNSTAVKYYAQWKHQMGQSNIASKKMSYYLSEFNFDEEMTKNHIEILKGAGRLEMAQSEAMKLQYYFGSAAAI